MPNCRNIVHPDEGMCTLDVACRSTVFLLLNVLDCRFLISNSHMPKPPVKRTPSVVCNILDENPLSVRSSAKQGKINGASMLVVLDGHLFFLLGASLQIPSTVTRCDYKSL